MVRFEGVGTMADGVLEVLVESPWVVETLKALGGGHVVDLTFAEGEIEPVTRRGFLSGELGAGTLGEVLLIGPRLRRVATFELHAVTRQPGYVRLDLRLLGVTPFVRDGVKAGEFEYRCRFRPEGSSRES
ncbi:MAG: hypothetical protein K6U03_05020 [Firmicutes bacterium]|nr:hypothetical protein [Bacillota bacterium]